MRKVCLPVSDAMREELGAGPEPGSMGATQQRYPVPTFKEPGPGREEEDMAASVRKDGESVSCHGRAQWGFPGAFQRPLYPHSHSF